MRGPGRFRLGSEDRVVADGAVVFIPAGVPHGLDNPHESQLSIQAVFPTSRVWIRTLERNPAPGTEDDPAKPGATYDFRTGAVEFDTS